MNDLVTPTFRRYLIAWFCAWFTLSSAALCGTIVVWTWTTFKEGFSLVSLMGVYGLTSINESLFGGMSFYLVVFSLICAAAQIWIGKILAKIAASRYAPRAISANPVTVATSIGILIGLSCLLLCVLVFGVDDGVLAGRGREASSTGFLLVYGIPLAGAAMAAGYGCIVQSTRETRRKMYRRAWTATARFVIACLYLVGADTPQYAVGDWGGQGHNKREILLWLYKDQEGLMDEHTSSDVSLFHDRIFWKEQGHALILKSGPDADRSSRVIATGTISKDARSITFHIAKPPESTTLTRPSWSSY